MLIILCWGYLNYILWGIFNFFNSIISVTIDFCTLPHRRILAFTPLSNGDSDPVMKYIFPSNFLGLRKSLLSPLPIKDQLQFCIWKTVCAICPITGLFHLYNALTTHPCFQKWQNFIFINGWLKFHYMQMYANFLLKYPFINS